MPSFAKSMRVQYTHDLKIFDYINERDGCPLVLMQWFISEQVEEEKNAKLIVDQLKLAGDNGSALLLLDRDLGGRKGGAAQAGESADAT